MFAVIVYTLSRFVEVAHSYGSFHVEFLDEFHLSVVAMIEDDEYMPLILDIPREK